MSINKRSSCSLVCNKNNRLDNVVKQKFEQLDQLQVYLFHWEHQIGSFSKSYTPV